MWVTVLYLPLSCLCTLLFLKESCCCKFFPNLFFFVTRTELYSKVGLGLISALGVICVKQAVCCVIPRPCFCYPLIDIFIAISYENIVSKESVV